MKNYKEFKKQAEKETNELSSEVCFFAFDKKQFAEGLEKFGIEREKAPELIVPIGGGGFALKSSVNDLREMSKKHDKELAELMQNEEFAVSAFDYELGNHEWVVTGDETDAIFALGYSVEDVKNSEHLLKCLKAALKKQREWAEKCW